MDPITQWLYPLDSFLIAPYRWFNNPLLGWFVGTLVISLWAVILGDLTLLLTFKINKGYIKSLLHKTDYYHEQSLKAKSAGDEKSYKKINWMANEQFGKSFFMLMAMGMGSLWPAFFAAGWLNERFGHLTFLVLPQWAGGYSINFIGPFVAIYLIARYIYTKTKVFGKNLYCLIEERTGKIRKK